MSYSYINENTPLMNQVPEEAIDDSRSIRNNSLPLVDAFPTLTKPRYIGALDQGTTSTRFIVFTHTGEIVCKYQKEFKNLYPRDGYHEQDPEVLYDCAIECIEEGMKKFKEETKLPPSAIESIGITNQRETTVVWDKTTGQALRNTIVWSDTRTRDLVRRYQSIDGSDHFKKTCGMQLSTYPSALKLRWMLDNEGVVASAYEQGNLCFGTVDTWLVYCLNGRHRAKEPVMVTDPSNASRTLFMELESLQYSKDLADWFDIDMAKINFPKICKSASLTDYGKIREGILSGCRIGGVLGDQSAALVGQLGFRRGDAKNTYGTGCFLLYNVGDKPVISKNGLVTTVAYDFGELGHAYALEGSVAVSGSGLTWLSDQLGVAPTSIAAAKLAEDVKDNGGVYFVTAFSGLFAPYWIDDAKGTLWGMSQFTNKGHIARATLEAICFQSKAILDAMASDSGTRLQRLAVDGGVSNSDLAMQTQANFTGITVRRPQMRETTALGAAIAAGLGVGVWSSLEHVTHDIRSADDDDFEPHMSVQTRRRLFGKWSQAVEMSRGWDSGNYLIRNSETGEYTRADVMDAGLEFIEEDSDETAVIEEADQEDDVIHMGATPAAHHKIKLPLSRVRSTTSMLPRNRSHNMLSRIQSCTSVAKHPHRDMCCMKAACRHGNRIAEQQQIQQSHDEHNRMLEQRLLDLVVPEKQWATNKVLTYVCIGQLMLIVLLILLFFHIMNQRVTAMSEL